MNRGLLDDYRQMAGLLGDYNAYADSLSPYELAMARAPRGQQEGLLGKVGKALYDTAKRRIEHPVKSYMEDNLGTIMALNPHMPSLWEMNPEMRQAELDTVAMKPGLLGDIAGPVADVNRYAANPDEWTALDTGLAGLGALPFVPALGGMVKSAKSLPMDHASRMKRANEMGFNKDVYSGSTHDIERMNGLLSNPENDFGRGTYSSTSIDDVNANYAGVGPDLTSRISGKSEEIADALADYPDELLDEYGYTLKDYEADEAGVAEGIARKMLIGEAEHGVVYPLKANTSDYAVIGGPESTRLENPDYYDLAKSEVDPKDYADEMDFKDAINERVYELEANDPDSLQNRIYGALNDSDIYGDEATKLAILTDVQDEIIDGTLDLDSLDSAIRKHAVDAYDDMGNLLSGGEISNQVMQNLGFKGVIDNNVSAKFGHGRQFGQAMEGVYPDTQHIITFPGHENTLRSINAVFDPKKKESSDLLAQIAMMGLLGGSVGYGLLPGDSDAKP